MIVNKIDINIFYIIFYNNNMTDENGLVNIIDTIVVSDAESDINSNILTTKDKNEIIESLLIVLIEFVNDNAKCYINSEYTISWVEYLKEYLYVMFKHIDDFDIEDDIMDTLIFETINIFEEMVPPRSLNPTCILYNQNDVIKKDVDNKLEIVFNKNRNCAAQKTTEWHKQRYKVITASVAWKALGTQSQKNALIYSKCKPLEIRDNFIGFKSAMHWGQKYEPISQQYYEYINQVCVSEYGCIPHTHHTFLGASPDGIVTTKTSHLYGRMIEIKNIVNRVINGIPKKEYWIQMQMQMECCDLEECDFLECRFNEYDNKEAFDQDGTFQLTQTGKI